MLPLFVDGAPPAKALSPPRCGEEWTATWFQGKQGRALAASPPSSSRTVHDVGKHVAQQPGAPGAALIQIHKRPKTNFEAATGLVSMQFDFFFIKAPGTPGDQPGPDHLV